MNLIAYFVVGELLVWLGQNASLAQKAWSKSSFLTELFKCDLCLGFWIFLVLSPLFSITIITAEWWPQQLLASVITACIATFVTHIFMIGLRFKFGTTVVE